MTTSRPKMFYTLNEFFDDTEDVRHDDNDNDYRQTSNTVL